MRYRCLSLVSGYHDCTFPPAEAYDAGLRERFAIVLGSFRPDRDGMCFDAKVFLRLGEALCAALPHTSLLVELPGGARFTSFGDLAREYARVSQDERDPPRRVRLFNGDDPVCVMDTEFWVNVGGPAIYHDSYTFSFYTAADHAESFRALCAGVCGDLDVNVTGFHQGARHKKPRRSFWRRVVRAFGAERA